MTEPSEELGIERIKWSPGEMLGRGPESAQIMDKGCFALAITE